MDMVDNGFSPGLEEDSVATVVASGDMRAEMRR